MLNYYQDKCRIIKCQNNSKYQNGEEKKIYEFKKKFCNVFSNMYVFNNGCMY